MVHDEGFADNLEGKEDTLAGAKDSWNRKQRKDVEKSRE